MSASSSFSEKAVSFNVAHYGKDEGLNGRFMRDDAVDFFAGGCDGGGGKFEDAENRDIAGAVPDVLAVCAASGLGFGDAVIDVGAGTGLFLSALSQVVGDSGKVLGVDISTKFVDFMKQRVAREGMTNVCIELCSAQSPIIAKEQQSRKFKCALICDAYHHFEYPITFMSELRHYLADEGFVVLIDFWRDPKKMVHHEPQWALDHLRAGREQFQSEIESAGFRLVDSPMIDALKENYCMIFRPWRADK